MTCWVYILKSINFDRYYIGSSSNPEKRLYEHNSGKTKSIKAFCPWVLVFKQQFNSRAEAVRVENKLKKYKSKKIIKQIVSDQYILGL